MTKSKFDTAEIKALMSLAVTYDDIADGACGARLAKIRDIVDKLTEEWGCKYRENFLPYGIAEMVCDLVYYAEQLQSVILAATQQKWDDLLRDAETAET